MNPNDNPTVTTKVINHPVIPPELNSPSNESSQSMVGVPFQILNKNFDGNERLNPIIHIRPEGVPRTIPRKKSSDPRKYCYHCSIYSPTSAISFTHNFITKIENTHIKIIEKLNLLRRNDTIVMNRTRLSRVRPNHLPSRPLPDYQLIARGACRGNKPKSQPTGCNIEFIWIRTNKYISLMILCDPGKDNGTKINHSPLCIRTKSSLSSELIELGLQLGSTVARIPSSIPDHPHPMKQYDHIANDQKNQLFLKSRKHKASVVISRRNCRLKKEVKTLQEEIRKDYKSEETLHGFIPSLKEYMNVKEMDIESFCELTKDMTNVRKNRDSIVILKHDLNNVSGTTRWEALVFVNIGVLELYLKIIEMSTYSKAFTSIMDGVTIIHNVRALIMSCCDYRRAHYPVMFAMCRRESKPAALMTMSVYNEIVYRLGGKIPFQLQPNTNRENLSRFIMLIDGSPALDAASTQVGAEVINCKTHMNERKKGIGTVGINDRGSLGRYLKLKHISKSPRKFFEYLNSCLFFLTDSIAYQNVLYMLYKYLLHRWIAEETNNLITPFVEVNATPLDVSQTMIKYICPYIKHVYKDDDNEGKQDSTKVLKREGLCEHTSKMKSNKDLHKCERIIIWFAAFYFPYFTKPRYGPGHVDGNPFDTNGGESLNNQYQRDAKILMMNKPCTYYQSFFQVVASNSHQPDTFQSVPVVSKMDMDDVLQYCVTKNSPKNKKIDDFFLYMVCYNARSHERIDRGKMIDHIRKSSINGGTVIYLPSQHLLESLLSEAKKNMIAKRNLFGYPTKIDPAASCKDENKRLFPYLYNLMIPHLQEMHPDILGVSENQCPTLEDIGRYVFKHASRLPNKVDVAQVNDRKSCKKDYAVEDRMNKCLQKYMESRPSSKKTSKKSDHEKLNIFQRALGSFIIIKIDDVKVVSNDENYFRFGSSFYSNFFAFVAYCDFPHIKDNVGWPVDKGQEGKEVCAKNLYDKLKQMFVKFPKTDMILEPPNRDPMSSP